MRYFADVRSKQSTTEMPTGTRDVSSAFALASEKNKTVWRESFEVQRAADARLTALMQKQGLTRLNRVLRQMIWERLGGRGGILHSWQSRAQGGYGFTQSRSRDCNIFNPVHDTSCDNTQQSKPSSLTLILPQKGRSALVRGRSRSDGRFR